VHYYQESYRYNPAKIDVISCLGMHHAKQDQFEKAIVYFERAFQIQPREVKWQLMIASCYRRMNLFNEALKVYEDIHAEYPDNIDCLRGLVQIRKELGMKYQHFSEKLMILDREEEAKRIMMGGANGSGYGGPGGDRDYYGGPPGGMGMGGAYDMGGPGMGGGGPGGDMMGDIQPKARKMAAAKKQDEDDDNWGNVDALLE
jgi:intraflagellar transport protein 88